MPLWANRFGAVALVVTLALAGVVYSVDGVALKLAVGAWASAPPEDPAAHFASVEAIRWLEWGGRRYYSFTLGLALVLLARRRHTCSQGVGRLETCFGKMSHIQEAD